MPVIPDASSSSSSTTIAEHMKLRRPRNQSHRLVLPESDPPPTQNPSARSKSAISSFFLPSSEAAKKKPSNFPQTASFRGLGCAASASQQVSVPAVIRTSADWEAKRTKKKKKNRKGLNGNNGSNDGGGGGLMRVVSENRGIDGGGCVIQDVWCGPGMGFSTDAVVGGTVDPVVSASRRNLHGRRKVDVERITNNHREGSSLFPRRAVTPEVLAFLDSDPVSVPTRPEPPFFASRYHRHLRHPSPDDLAEIMMLHNGIVMGGRSDSYDHFHDWRLDVDNMSYEQLLELGDRIGYVNTGLKDDEINGCLRRTRPSIFSTLPSNLVPSADKSCSVCQEEYNWEDEAGKLNCGHSFHIGCIKQWLSQKNSCPVCKATALPRP